MFYVLNNTNKLPTMGAMLRFRLKQTELGYLFTIFHTQTVLLEYQTVLFRYQTALFHTGTGLYARIVMFHYQIALFHNPIVISHNQTGLLDYQPW